MTRCSEKKEEKPPSTRIEDIEAVSETYPTRAGRLQRVIRQLPVITSSLSWNLCGEKNKTDFCNTLQSKKINEGTGHQAVGKRGIKEVLIK